jgi:hypothetical protein
VLAAQQHVDAVIAALLSALMPLTECGSSANFVVADCG